MNGDLNDKDTLEQHVREVQAGSATNLNAGLARGFEVNLTLTLTLSQVRFYSLAGARAG